MESSEQLNSNFEEIDTISILSIIFLLVCLSTFLPKAYFPVQERILELTLSSTPDFSGQDVKILSDNLYKFLPFSMIVAPILSLLKMLLYTAIIYLSGIAFNRGISARNAIFCASIINISLLFLSYCFVIYFKFFYPVEDVKSISSLLAPLSLSNVLSIPPENHIIFPLVMSVNISEILWWTAALWSLKNRDNRGNMNKIMILLPLWFIQFIVSYFGFIRTMAKQ